MKSSRKETLLDHLRHPHCLKLCIQISFCGRDPLNGPSIKCNLMSSTVDGEPLRGALPVSLLPRFQPKSGPQCSTRASVKTLRAAVVIDVEDVNSGHTGFGKVICIE